ncbi:hypothetical protein RUM44_003497 [Polyplax serrata]|uniref:Uncharacterized protein n=1 Tax=Polyplax serrata TaxID=468196 RepID=A0ABR1AGL4_POLSC
MESVNGGGHGSKRFYWKRRRGNPRKVRNKRQRRYSYLLLVLLGQGGLTRKSQRDETEYSPIVSDSLVEEED